MQDNVKKIINNLLRAIEYERDEERERHLIEIKTLKGFEREEKGRAIIDLRKKKTGRTIGGEWLYSFRKNNRHKISDTQINIGDQVIVSQFDPLDQTNPIGIVYEVNSNSIILSFTKSLKISNSVPIRIDLFVNDITFKRMEEALVKSKSHSYSKLQTIFAGQYHANTSVSNYLNNDLNEIQNLGVDYAVGNNGFYSIQGPPGTGKTYTAAYLIKEIIRHKKRVLITADSNAALDNLIRKCADLGMDPLRIGNPIRVNKDLKQYTLDFKVLSHILFKDINNIEEEIAGIKLLQDTLERPSMKNTRGVPYDELLELTKHNKTTRGISKQVLKAIKPWLKAQKKLDDLYNKISEVRSEIQYELLYNHSIIASTNSTAGCDLLLDEEFDFVIIDEAAQASIPSALIPILKGNRFVLIGDHFQLPPVVISQVAKELKLDLSLMDFLAKLYPYQLTRLDVQYRMHSKINNIVSTMFYDKKLIPHKTVANRLLLGDKNIIDVVHVAGEERQQKDSKSYYNIQEMHEVEKYVKKLLEKGVSKDQIAIISPYKSQALRIFKRLNEEIETDTVDAFQGREKDVVIISFVRSNSEQVIGFLKDYRRLNVSISRAKSKLVLICNTKTLKGNALYRDMFKIIRNQKEH